MLNKSMLMLMTLLLMSCAESAQNSVVLDTPKDADQVRAQRYGKLFGDIEFQVPISSETAPTQQLNNNVPQKVEAPKK